MKSVKYFPEKDELEEKSSTELVIENYSGKKQIPFRKYISEFTKKDSNKNAESETKKSDIPEDEVKEFRNIKVREMNEQSKHEKSEIEQDVRGRGSQEPLHIKSGNQHSDKDAHDISKETGINFVLGKLKKIAYRDSFSDHEHLSLFHDLKKRIGRTIEGKMEKKDSTGESSHHNQHLTPVSISSPSDSGPSTIEVPQQLDTNKLNHIEKGKECYEDMSPDSDTEEKNSATHSPIKDSQDKSKCSTLPIITISSTNVSDSAENLQSKESMALCLSTLRAKDTLDSDLDVENEYYENYETVSSFSSSDMYGAILSTDSNEVYTQVPITPTIQEERTRFAIFNGQVTHCVLVIWDYLNPHHLLFSLAMLTCASTISLLPLAPYLRGFVSGILMSFLIGRWLWDLTKPPKEKKPLKFSDIPQFKIPLHKMDNELNLYKGWMNEYCDDYNPKTFRLTDTRSVYVRLDGTILRLSLPKKNVPHKAMWNESEHQLHFTHQRHYNILGAKVLLLPPELMKSTRLWKRNYPIYLSILDVRRKCSLLPVKKTLSSEYHETEDESKESMNRSLSSVHVSSHAFRRLELCLFARTNKEKEEWYYRFRKAACGHVFPLCKKPTKLLSLPVEDSTVQPSLDTVKSSISEESTHDKSHLDFNSYMASLLRNDNPLGSCADEEDPEFSQGNNPNTLSTNILWLNIFFGRMFYDFFAQKHWSDVVSSMIQKKLSRIKVPYFMQKLKVSDVFLGTSLPIIRQVHPVKSDRRGLWVYLDIEYSGSFLMTLETKVDLIHLRKRGKSHVAASKKETHKETIHRSSDYGSDSGDEDDDDDSDDSVVSSLSDDEQVSDGNDTSGWNISTIHSSAMGTGGKVLKVLEKIANSPYFQHVTENAYVKKAIEGVTNTPLLLTVEVLGLCGTLGLNLPPPPTDRLWYGFPHNPQLSLSAHPKFGEIEVNITHITKWIEKKLILEFQKALVFPNMDDIKVPIMQSGIADQSKS